MEKENTKKNNKSFKQSIYKTSYIDDLNYNGKYKIYYEKNKTQFPYSKVKNLIYYANNEEEYKNMKPKLINEIELLFNKELKDIINKHPILLNHNRTKLESNNFINNKDSVFDSIINILLNLNDNTFPIINGFINNFINDDFRYKNYNNDYNKNKIVYNCLYEMIYFNFKDNNNIKSMFKIESHNKGEFKSKEFLYYSKSKNWNDNKSRDWRNKIEHNRIKKERRETKKNINN